MKKLFLVLLLAIAAVSTYAQSRLCLVNDAKCDAHFAIFAEAPAAPPPGPYVGGGLRIDFLVPGGSSVTYCFSDYDDARLNSLTGDWWSGHMLPPATSAPSIGFAWDVAQIQFQECDPVGGCGLQVGNGSSPSWPTTASSGCMNAEYTSIPGGVQFRIW